MGLPVWIATEPWAEHSDEAVHAPALHRAWIAAQGAELLTVGHREACAATTTAGPIDQ